MLVQLILYSSITVATAAGATDALIEDMINELGFQLGQKGDLESGKVISVGLPLVDGQPTEVTVGAAMMLVRRPLPTVSEVLMSNETFHVNTEILDFGVIGDGSASDAEIDRIFGKIRYDETEDDEVARLLNAKPGEQFNLSEAEIGRFRQVQGEKDYLLDEVSGTLADMLKRRFLLYLEGGLNAIDPYARKRNKSASPQQELTTAFASLKLLKRHFPTFYASLTGFPAPVPENTRSGFYWIKRIADERPAFVLSHRMAERGDDYTVAMELQYYAQHSYNSMLTLVGYFPTDEGTLVLSVIRVYTDKVTGFGSGMRKDIGRKHVAEAMAEYFLAVRPVLEYPSIGSGR